MPAPARGTAAELSVRTRWLAYTIGGFGIGAMQQINFLVPLHARALGIGFDSIGLLIAAAAVAPALLSVPLGAAVDRFGTKASFIAATAATGAVAAAMAIANGFLVLLLLQLLIGVTRTSGWLASQTYVTGLAHGRDRAALSGRFGFFGNLGGLVGPLAAGGVAQAFGYPAAFRFLAAYAIAFSVLGLFLTAAPTPEGSGPPRGGSGFRDARGLLALHPIRVALTLTAARLWVSWTWTGFFPALIVDAGVTPGTAGTVVAVKGLVAMAAAPATSTWSRFGTPATTTAVGLGLGALGLVAAPFTTSVPLVYLSALLVGIATGVSLPLLMTMISDSAPSSQRGTALGLRQSVNGVAAAGAPLLVGPLLGAMGTTLAFAASGGVAATVLLFAAVARPRGRT